MEKNDKKGLIAGESLAKIHQEKIKTAPPKIEDNTNLYSVRLKKSFREEIRKHGSLAYVLKRGLQALYAEPNFINRIRESEEDITLMKSKIRNLAIENNNLKGKIYDIEKSSSEKQTTISDNLQDRESREFKH